MKGFLIIIAFIFSFQVANSQKLKWDIDGKSNLVSANLRLHYPMAYSWDKDNAWFQPGLEINYRKVFNPKNELDIGMAFSKLKYDKQHKDEFVFPSSTIATFNDPVIGNFVSYHSSLRRYRTKNEKGFAPIGRYFRFGFQYEKVKVSLPSGTLYNGQTKISTPIESETRNYTAVAPFFGIGKEFAIKDRLFLGFNLNGMLNILTTEWNPEDELIYGKTLNVMSTIYQVRNLIVVNYNISYLLF